MGVKVGDLFIHWDKTIIAIKGLNYIEWNKIILDVYDICVFENHESSAWSGNTRKLDLDDLYIAIHTWYIKPFWSLPKDRYETRRLDQGWELTFKS